MSQQGTWLKQRESALKTRRIETLLGENPVASTSLPNSQLQSHSVGASNPNVFMASSVREQQNDSQAKNHSPAAPRDAGTPMRESRLGNIPKASANN